MSPPTTKGDDVRFVAQVERYRRALQLHCYRMVGSLEDSEDLAQEAILRAWRKRSTFEGRSALSSWLYQIATNACLDFLKRRSRRAVPPYVAVALQPGTDAPPASELIWLDPYPESLLEGIPSEDDDPASALTAKETVEIAFLMAIQYLPPRSRAVLILRDVLGWSAKETAATLDLSLAAVNSALARARATLKDHLPRRRVEWPGADPSQAEREVMRRYVDAHERGDADRLAELLRDDMRLAIPPLPPPRDGREAFVASVRRSAEPGRFRYVTTSANGQPAAASYVRNDAGTGFRPLAIDVLRIEGGAITEISVFLRPELFRAFGLPDEL